MSRMSGDIVNDRATSILLLGDMILDVADADHWLSGIAPALRAADLAVAHLEVPHTDRGVEMAGDVPAPGASPDALAAAARAGIAAVSMAGNHMADCGAEGIADTIATLDTLEIAHAGAGSTLAAARAAAFLHVEGRTIALLSYNCVGPESSWAGPDQAGCAYLPVATADGSPVRPTAPLTMPTRDAETILAEDIAAARSRADLVIVSLHKGVVHTPALLAPYELPIAHAAVDAGADVVFGHHAHIVKGLEMYRGKPIFHGLGNGCVVTRALSPGQDHPARAEWASRREELFGFKPDPAYELAPFHPDAVHAMLGRLLWHADGRIEAGIVPVHVEAPGRPVLADAAQGEIIRHYIEDITRRGGLPDVTLVPTDDMLVLA
jgi:poly-gamma-glutamate capsule biosynthesis protein CapA/YwtB (metallophosphatase superfamily)